MSLQSENVENWGDEKVRYVCESKLLFFSILITHLNHLTPSAHA